MEAIDSPMDEQRHGGASGERGMGRESAAAAEESRRFFLPSVSSFPLSPLRHSPTCKEREREGREGKKARAANELRTAP